MCRFCAIATVLLGRGYMCRPCWRQAYRNRGKKKAS